MKKLIFVLMITIFGATGFAQNKNAKATIEVDGVCGMCKDRIEKASIKTKGVKSASWDVKTHQLDLIYNEGKTDLAKIQQSIADSGHDTEDIKAKEEVYAKIDDCCKYRDENVVNDHKD
ncbi:heavy-metal-associated domain-containing protein [Aequorivita echinoideorum]|uniref:Heavy-metal-associated domain-containing protein n=1 Tax=Aequorivita echinoideorum TaxID=1549647 RepID=A0ABS5S291_9FLAO|nr:heavy-metal-associated domain-containing protein [Aequorivita echinoideorum]MBT0607303.1 heavy-metal-associated domain-containing protein [Aequorivita echinoideorum]